MAKNEIPLNEIAASVVLEALKNAINSSSDEIDWVSLKEEWMEYFEYIENKGIVLGLEIALKKWDNGGFNDLMEERAHYRELVEEVESNF